MVFEFYEFPASPFCRSIQMLASLLKIKLETKIINELERQQNHPEYLAINPFHKIPTLVNDGFVVYESRAILRYLANKHESSLYPKDLKERAIVDQMLDVDATNLAPSITGILRPLIQAGKIPSEEDKKPVQEVLANFDVVLAKTGYAAGGKLTIADLSLRTTITLLEFLDIDLTEYKNVSIWADKVRNEVPNYAEINDEPINKFKAVLKAKKQQNA